MARAFFSPSRTKAENVSGSKRPTWRKSRRMKPASPSNLTAWPCTPGTSCRSSGAPRRSNVAGLPPATALSTPFFVKASSGRCTTGAGTVTTPAKAGTAGTAARFRSAVATASRSRVSFARSSSDLKRRTKGGGTSPWKESRPFSFWSPNIAAREKKSRWEMGSYLWSWQRAHSIVSPMNA